MRIVGWVVLVALATSGLMLAQDKGVAPQLKSFTVIRAGTLIDGKSDAPRHDQIILIRGHLIDSVSDAASAKIPQGANVIDLSKATVLPGLIDSHTHIFLQGEDPAEGGYDAQHPEVSACTSRGPGNGFRTTRAGTGLYPSA